jgi:hypothetical protein
MKIFGSLASDNAYLSAVKAIWLPVLCLSAAIIGKWRETLAKIFYIIQWLS